jgi:outer membrane protein TolC
VAEILAKIDQDLSRIAVAAEAAVKSGAVPKFATMQIQVAQVELTAKRAEAEANRKLATLAFKDSVGLDSMENVKWDSPLVKINLKHGLDVFKTKALNGRSEFTILEQKSLQVQALKTAKTGEMMPTMFLFGSYNVARENLPLLTNKWVAGVGLNVPITAGLSQVPERRKAIQLAQKIDIFKAKALAQIPLQIEQLYDHCSALKGALETTESSFNLAAEVQRLAEARFKSGAGSTVEVLKANTDNQAAQVRYAMLLEEYNRHLIELYKASGSIEYYVSDYMESSKIGGAQ